jgi:PhnB protein
MAEKASPIPRGYHSVTPYIIVEGAERAIDFYRRAFGAEELLRMEDPSGRIGHAEIRIGDSPVMLADAVAEMGYKDPKSLGGSPVSLMIYVEDVDAVFARAVEAGAKAQRPVEDKFFGDRMGSVEDPFGHVWHLATHREDVSPEELKRRAAAEFSKREGAG